MEELINILYLSTLIVAIYLVFFAFAVVYIHNNYKVDRKLTEEELYILFKNRKQYY